MSVVTGANYTHKLRTLQLSSSTVHSITLKVLNATCKYTEALAVRAKSMKNE